MSKIPSCDRCHYFANDYHIVCAPHPYGPDDNNCPDFSPDPDLERKQFVDFLGLQRQTNLEPDDDLWEPEGASYYAGELIMQPRQRWTREEMLDLLDTHPILTGVCPSCSYRFPQAERPPVNYDCPSCSWVDDTV